MRGVLFRDLPSERWPSMDRYAESLASAIREIAPTTLEITMPVPPDPWHGGPGRLAGRLLRYPLWARSLRADFFHVLDHSYAHLLFVLDPARTIVTVHDLAPLSFQGSPFGLSTLAWRIAWSGLQRAQHVIVDSQFIGSELQAHLNLPPERIHHVPLAVSPQFHPHSTVCVAAVRERYLHDAEFLLLHVGSAQPRKNLPVLIKAAALLRQSGLNVQLLQVGGQPGTELKAMVRNMGPDAFVRFLGTVSETELPLLYGAADVFVFPSLYEGFGLPILEAMACGTPVVAGKAASLPEVAGEAALLAEPTDAEALADQIARLLNDDGMRIKMRAQGLRHATKFTWERSAKATLAVYESVDPRVG